MCCHLSASISTNERVGFPWWTGGSKALLEKGPVLRLVLRALEDLVTEKPLEKNLPRRCITGNLFVQLFREDLGCLKYFLWFTCLFNSFNCSWKSDSKVELLVSYWICAVQKFPEATENINSNFLVYIWYTERVYHIHHSFIRSTQIHSKHPLRISFQHLGNPAVPCLVIIVIISVPLLTTQRPPMVEAPAVETLCWSQGTC